MASVPKDVPHTREDRQAIATVASMHEVFDEITKLADILKEEWRPVAQRNDAKHELAHASERLCNLMELALYQVSTMTTSALADQLRKDLDQVRENLVDLGGRLVVEKLEKIDRRAEEVLQERDFPIGLSGKLGMAFHHLMANLGVLGGAEKLGENVPTLVAKTETGLKSLSEMEKMLGILLEVQPEKKRKS
jgi:hypothetical protein